MYLELPDPTDLNELRLATLTNALRIVSEWMLRASAPVAYDDPERSVCLLQASRALRVVLSHGRTGTPEERFRDVLGHLEQLAADLRSQAAREGPSSVAAVASEIVDPIVRDAVRAPRWLRRYQGPSV